MTTVKKPIHGLHQMENLQKSEKTNTNTVQVSFMSGGHYTPKEKLTSTKKYVVAALDSSGYQDTPINDYHNGAVTPSKPSFVEQSTLDNEMKASQVQPSQKEVSASGSMVQRRIQKLNTKEVGKLRKVVPVATPPN